jgi:hypothetical protein
MKLSLTRDNFAVCKRSVWNGGEGMEFRLLVAKIENMFVERGLDRVKTGVETMPVELAAEQVWIDEKAHGMDAPHLEARNANYLATFKTFEFPDCSRMREL